MSCPPLISINNPCPSYPKAQCIVYEGVNLTCVGINTNDRLDSILAKIDSALCGVSSITASNIGTGHGVFSSKVNDDLRFRSLLQGTGIIITDTANEIVFTVNTTYLDGLYFKQGGNSFGAIARLGTNDNFNLEFETNNVRRATITTSGKFLLNNNTDFGNYFLQMIGGVLVNTQSQNIELITGSNGTFILTILNGALSINDGTTYLSKAQEIIHATAVTSAGQYYIGYHNLNDNYDSLIGTIKGYYNGTVTYNTLGQADCPLSDFGSSWIYDTQDIADNENAVILHIHDDTGLENEFFPIKFLKTGKIYIGDSSGSGMRLIALSTDNTATQIAAKDSSGDTVWRDVSSISGGGNINQSIQSGDGIITSFIIAHTLVGTPKVLLTAIGVDSSGYSYITVDATNITVVYNVAPPTGTNNLIFNWQANL